MGRRNDRDLAADVFCSCICFLATRATRRCIDTSIGWPVSFLIHYSVGLPLQVHIERRTVVDTRRFVSLPSCLQGHR